MKIARLIHKILPPDRWKVAVILLAGSLTGLFAFLFYVSKASSYLGDDPATCVNCHIMAPQYTTWSHSAHREVATCNDCHVPQDNFFRKYYFKAKDGMRHATFFTLRMEPQVIFIGDDGRDVVHENCIRCHEYMLTDEKMKRMNSGFDMQRKDRLCWDCHRETPHGRVNSLNSTPNARVPLPSSAVPGWLKELMNENPKQ